MSDDELMLIELETEQEKEQKKGLDWTGNYPAPCSLPCSRSKISKMCR